MAGGNPAIPQPERQWYPTPVEVTKALLKVEKFEGIIVEPACGDGSMAKVFEAAGYKVFATDIHPLGYGKKIDFFKYNKPLRGANIVTNPPFELSVRFIEHALSLESRTVCMMLKGTYWHAVTRLKLFEGTKPAAVYPLTWRPDFRGLGRPTMECCWTVWRRDYDGPTIYQPLEKPE